MKASPRTAQGWRCPVPSTEQLCRATYFRSLSSSRVNAGLPRGQSVRYPQPERCYDPTPSVTRVPPPAPQAPRKEPRPGPPAFPSVFRGADHHPSAQTRPPSPPSSRQGHLRREALLELALLPPSLRYRCSQAALTPLVTSAQ